eukprot:scaffold7041_cov63-Attheya_sp.AAC.1
MQLQHNPGATIPGTHLIPKSIRVAFRLPRLGLMCPFVAQQLYTDPILALENIKMMGGMQPSLWVRPSTAAWMLMKRPYPTSSKNGGLKSREVADNASSELEATIQTMMVNGKMVTDDLPEYFQRFSDMLDLFDPHMPIPLPHAATFREGMTETLKGQLHVQGYRDPIGQITDNDLQMEQLMQLKLLAATAEKAIAATRQQVGLPATNHRNPISAYMFQSQTMGMEMSAAQLPPNASATNAPPMLTNDLVAAYNTEVTVATGLANNLSSYPTLAD